MNGPCAASGTLHSTDIPTIVLFLRLDIGSPDEIENHDPIENGDD